MLFGQYIECKNAKTKDLLSQKYYPAINNILDTKQPRRNSNPNPPEIIYFIDINEFFVPGTNVNLSFRYQYKHLPHVLITITKILFYFIKSVLDDLYLRKKDKKKFFHPNNFGFIDFKTILIPKNDTNITNINRSTFNSGNELISSLSKISNINNNSNNSFNSNLSLTPNTKSKISLTPTPKSTNVNIT